jgi:hypothetical protein
MFYGKQPRKENGFYVVDAPDWAIREYGMNVGSKGDLIYENMFQIWVDRDGSPWAYNCVIMCADLLLLGKRWPDSMNQAIDAKTWLGMKWSDLLYKLRLIPSHKYRPQKGFFAMTRDPYISFYNTCLALHLYELIEEVAMPWYCYNPKVWRWRRRLIKDNRKLYVRRLDMLMASAVLQNYTR